MILDLRNILEGWEYEPGKISVRKIIGQDGREKIQTRVDLGVLQFEVSGRPDGVRPHGFDTSLNWLESRLREHVARSGSEAGFQLSADECKELRHESHLYYQRFLSNFVLEEFAAVEADTARNLRLLDFCNRYAESESDRDALEGQRAYILMMNTRARVYLAIARDDYPAAMALIDDGIEEIRELTLLDPIAADGEDPPELQVLGSLREEILGNMPEDAIPRLEKDLREAVAAEEYERAASLRDRLEQRRRENAA